MTIKRPNRKAARDPMRIYHALMKTPGWFAVITNTRFELLAANDYFYAYFECKPEDLNGRSLCEFLSDETRRGMDKAHIDRVLAEGNVWDYDARTTRPDGEGILIRWNQCALPDTEEILSVGYVLHPKADGEPQPASSLSDSETDTRIGPHPPAPPFYIVDHTAPQETNPADRPAVTEYDIRHALTNRLFLLFHQPIIHSRTKKIVGAEALVRMKHPEYGILPPVAFIPTAEATGQIVSIGEYVLDAACKKIKRWTDNGLDLFLSVNVSNQQFMHESFTETLLGAITRHDVAAERLILEITEDTTSRDTEQMRSILQTVRSMGTRISLDDFGLGFTSLRNLEKLKIDNMKIDRFFLSKAMQSGRFLAIIESIIVLAHGMNLSVTAEGVETQAQLEFLSDKSCDFLQGFLISHPLPEADFDRLLYNDPNFFRRHL